MRTIILLLSAILLAAPPLLAGGSVQETICTGKDSILPEGTEYLISFTSPDPRAGGKYFIYLDPDESQRDLAGVWQKAAPLEGQEQYWEPKALRYEDYHCVERTPNGEIRDEYDRAVRDIPLVEATQGRL